MNKPLSIRPGNDLGKIYPRLNTYTLFNELSSDTTLSMTFPATPVRYHQ